MADAPSTSPTAVRRLVIAALIALWAQLYLAAVPIWRFGEYYNYGWYVPPFAAFFFYRRWRELPETLLSAGSTRVGWIAWLALALVPLLATLRALNYVDGGWRPPILLHALIVVVVSHVLLGRIFGWRTSWFFAPVTVFALCAIPWPWQLEQQLIRRLTGLVVIVAGELFNLSGRPVEVIGENLASMGESVSVTDACSGIRSFQNLVMASLFFGEMFLLQLWPRIALLVVGVVVAVIVNIGRAMTLAVISFDQGEDAFERAHDFVGHAAFVIAAVILLAMASVFHHFRSLPRGRVVVKTVGAGVRAAAR